MGRLPTNSAANAAINASRALGLHGGFERQCLEERIEALLNTLDCAVDIWMNDGSGDGDAWQLVEKLGDLSETTGPIDDESLGELLSHVCSGKIPQKKSLAGGLAAIAAPLSTARKTTRGPQTQLAATALVAESDGPYALRAAELALEQLELRQEVVRLQRENRVFAQQLSDDFEELTFLRIMASHLELESTTVDSLYVVSQTLEDLQRLIGAETLCYVDLNPAGKPQIAVRRPLPEAGSEANTLLLEAVINHFCVEQNRRLTVANYSPENPPPPGLRGLHQLLVVPVSSGVRQYGWFAAINRIKSEDSPPGSPMLQLDQTEYGTWEASLLSTAGTIVASHASNLELLQEKEVLLVNVVRSFVSAIDSKDAYTRGHSERVALFGRCVAEHMGYDPLAAERIYLSGLLHDVGKIGVSDATLNKPGALCPDERREIERHPDEGWAILQDLKQLKYVLPGVLHHHERHDGKGYPDGLVGKQIPLDARILAVVDSYDAMTSNRAYRNGMTHDKATSILAEGAGLQWDPQVIAAFFAVIPQILRIRIDYVPRERTLRLGPEIESAFDNLSAANDELSRYAPPQPLASVKTSHS